MDEETSSDEEILYEPSDEEVWIEEEESDSSDEENRAPTTSGNARERGYGDFDAGPPKAIPPFRPERPPGAQIPDSTTREARRKYLTPLSMFKLYFTATLVQQLCSFTNKNAAVVGPTKPSMYCNWVDLTGDEFYRFVGLLMYMGMVQVPNVDLYWCKKSLYNGLWARAFMSKFRFRQILCFLNVSDAERERVDDKLCKVRLLFEFLRRKCMKLYQPDMNISIDERMVRNKGRFSFRQYIRDKPTKWDMKLWVLADSRSGYTFNFDVYLGKNGRENSKYGLAYDVVMNLVHILCGQGYRLFVDNFYTSVQLFFDLLKKGIAACGTILSNRKGFPADLKYVKQWEKSKDRGAMRWSRQQEILGLQWKDNKTVSFISTIHSANDINM